MVSRLERVVPTEGTTMTILVTGASGHLGRLVVESLLERGVPGPFGKLVVHPDKLNG